MLPNWIASLQILAERLKISIFVFKLQVWLKALPILEISLPLAEMQWEKIPSLNVGEDSLLWEN